MPFRRRTEPGTEPRRAEFSAPREIEPEVSTAFVALLGVVACACLRGCQLRVRRLRGVQPPGR